MRTFILLALACVLLAVPAGAQPNMEDMDFPPLMTEDGLRIFFDASVGWMFGGIIANPILEFWQTQPLVDAYLVVTHPSAAQLEGFRVRSEILGNHVVTGWEVLGAPLSVQVIGDEIQVGYEPALDLDGSPVTLIHWSLLNVTLEPVSFYLRPPEGYETPVYFDGEGLPVATHTFNGAFHDHQVPVVVLNGWVTPIETTSWGGIKALFR